MKKVTRFYSPVFVRNPGGLVKELVGDRSIQVDVLDFSQTGVEEIDNNRRKTIYVRTHKGHKAEKALKHVEEQGGNFAVIVTSGNAGHACDVEANYHPDIQVIKFMNNARKPVSVIDNGYDNPSVSIKLPDIWLTSGELERFWKTLIAGNLAWYKENSDFDILLKLIEDRKLDPDKVVDVTNALDYSNEPPYMDLPEAQAVVDNYVHGFCPLGSAELARSLQKLAIDRGSSIKLACNTGFASPCSLEQRAFSSAKMLDTPRAGRAHVELMQNANAGTYFCSLPDAKIDEAYRVMNGLIRRGKLGNLRTSPSASISFAPFIGAKHYLGGTLRELVLAGVYRLREDFVKDFALEGLFEQCGGKLAKLINQETLNESAILQSYVINPGEKVCIINTGGSREYFGGQ